MENAPRNVAVHALVVDLCGAKPNKMFTEEQCASVRFLRYNQAVPCAECGRRRRTHWTLLMSFEAQNLGSLVPQRSGKIHPPLAPVCRDHILAAAAWEERKGLQRRRGV
jgi:hypothetical protein